MRFTGSLLSLPARTTSKELYSIFECPEERANSNHASTRLIKATRPREMGAGFTSLVTHWCGFT